MFSSSAGSLYSEKGQATSDFRRPTHEDDPLKRPQAEMTFGDLSSDDLNSKEEMGR